MKGQLSAEMLILIAVVIAVVAIAASRLISTARTSSDQIEGQASNISDMADNAVKSKLGEFCTRDIQCLSGNCDDGGTGATYTCQ